MSQYDLLLCNRIAQISRSRQLPLRSKVRIRDLVRNVNSAFQWKGVREKATAVN